MTHKVDLHLQAEEDFLEAYAWYSERSETAARAFLREMWIAPFYGFLKHRNDGLRVIR